MALWLTEQQAETIVHDARQAAPAEICGLIGGRDGQAYHVVPIQNIAANPQHHFEMAPHEFVRAMFDFEAQGLSLVAVFHSHPTSDAIPSPIDIREFHYPDVDYLIVGLGNTQPQLAVWNIKNAEVDRVELHIGATKPDLDSVRSLSNAQRAAIVLSLILAAVFLIAVSLVLLPPAPEIP